METSILFETPVAYPLIGDNNVFIVNDREGSTRLVDSSSDAYQSFATSDVTGMIGVSSVSEINYESTAKNSNHSSSTPVIVTTSPVADRILAITRIIPNVEPLVTYLDLSLECSIFTESVVAVKAFSCNAGKDMQLVLVNAAGVVLTLRFTIDSLKPVEVPRSSSGSIGVRCFVPAAHVEAPEQFTSPLDSPTVSSTMVTFGSADVVLLSLNPHFLSIDLFNESVHSWSKSECLAKMRAQSSIFGTIFQKSADLLLGVNISVFDMEPVAAVCTADNAPETVFTLHADGAVRHWTMASNSLEPCSVRDVVLATKRLPDPALWSMDSLQRSLITARKYESVFALCIHVQAEVMNKEADADDMVESTPGSTLSKHVIVAVDVPTKARDDEEYAASTHAISLTVPITSTYSCLVAMQFDPHAEDCRMRALFLTTSDSPPALATSVLCTYNQILQAVHSLKPSVLNPNLMLDGAARQEFERIDSLSFSAHLLQRTDLSLDQAIFEMDRHFMKYLFRPIYPRGSGTTLPPTSYHIRRAMQLLLPSFRSSDRGEVELEVGRFVAECRKHARRSAAVSPVKRRNASSVYESTSASYSTLEMHIAEVQEEQGTMIVVEETEASYSQIKREVLEHERFWKNLLLSIAQRESFEGIPVGMWMAPSLNADAAVVVRPGCVCALTRTTRANEQRRELDKKVVSLLDILNRDMNTRIILTELEQHIRESVLSGQLAINPEVIDDFKSRLKGPDVLARNMETRTLVLELEHISDGHWKALMNDSSFECSLPGLCLIQESWPNSWVADHSTPSQAVMGIQGRLAASCFLSRTTDSIRQLCYARWIVVSAMNVSAATESLALRMYLHSIAVMGVAAQTITYTPVSAVDIHAVNTDANTLTLPPKKRSKISNFLDINETLVSDSLLMHLSQRLAPSVQPDRSIAMSTIQLGSAAVTSCFQFGNRSPSELPDYSFPELGVLVSTNGDICEPNLALCLLSIAVALQLPEDSKEALKHRESLLAQCLILSSRSKSTANASEMINKALSLLPFDVSCLKKSITHLRTLESRMVDDATGGKRLVMYIHEAIQSCHLANISVDDSIFETLYSALFSSAISIREWPQACRAASEYPVGEKKLEKYERLIMAMVDAGALEELLGVSSQLAVSSEATQNVVYFSGIATETLSKMTQHYMYSSLVVDRASMPDYSYALFAQQISLGQWKHGSETMDMRFVNAREALNAEVPELNQEQKMIRYRLIVDDMEFAAASSFSAMSMESDPSAKFLVSGKRENDSHVPYDMRGEGVDSATVSKKSTPVRCMKLVDLEVRAIRVKVLKTLLLDSESDASFSLRALASEGTELLTPSDEICDQLFTGGFYTDGLLLARVMDDFRGCSPNGRSVFYGCISHLILDYLVPLALDSDCVPQRPTILQLEDAVESVKLGEQNEIPAVCLAGSRSKKLSEVARAEIRVGAMVLIRELTLKYTSAREPLAVEVAEEMLRSHRAATPLPPWLENLLVLGTVIEDLPGLFSRRRTLDTSGGYLGNPVALLDVYTSSGLLCDACKLVTAVLTRSNSRTPNVSYRRPEKGEMDDLPERKIDLLWNLIDGRLEENLLVGDERGRTVEARANMERSLEKYFALMDISERGLQSARALS